jgi:hypothetical protein
VEKQVENSGAKIPHVSPPQVTALGEVLPQPGLPRHITSRRRQLSIISLVVEFVSQVKMNWTGMNSTQPFEIIMCCLHESINYLVVGRASLSKLAPDISIRRSFSRIWNFRYR